MKSDEQAAKEIAAEVIRRKREEAVLFKDVRDEDFVLAGLAHRDAQIAEITGWICHALTLGYLGVGSTRAQFLEWLQKSGDQKQLDLYGGIEELKKDRDDPEALEITELRALVKEAQPFVVSAKNRSPWKQEQQYIERWLAKAEEKLIGANLK